MGHAPDGLCHPFCLVQADDLQLDKAVVAGKTGRTARHLRCQSAEVKVVGVRTKRTVAPIADVSTNSAHIATNCLLITSSIGRNRALVGRGSLYPPTTHPARITCNAVSHTNNDFNSGLRSGGCVLKIVAE